MIFLAFAVEMKGLGVAIMAAPTVRKRQPIYMREMMECLGIEPGGGVVPSLGLSYATAFHRCEACPSKQACRDWLDVYRRQWRLPRASGRMPKSSLNCRLINLARGLITRAVEVNYHAHKTDDLAQCRRVLSRDMVGFSLILEDLNVGNGPLRQILQRKRNFRFRG
jgi:hypothetical protein